MSKDRGCISFVFTLGWIVVAVVVIAKWASKHDSSYIKDTIVSVIGAIVLIAFIVWLLTQLFSNTTQPSKTIIQPDAKPLNNEKKITQNTPIITKDPMEGKKIRINFPGQIDILDEKNKVVGYVDISENGQVFTYHFYKKLKKK